jgi:hypothetical protein
VDDLGDDVLVGEADDEAVLGRIVLVLGLGDQPLTSVVVGCDELVMYLCADEESVHTLALAAALVLDLVPREVRVILLEFGLFPESAIDASNRRSKQLAKTPLDTRGCGVPHHDAGRGNAARIQNTLTVGMLAILLGELEDDC